MARVDVKMPDEFLERMSRLGSSFDSIAETVLEAGGEVVLEKTKSNLASVIGNGTKYDSRSTGELESSLGLTGVKMDRNGNFNIKVGFSEPRRDGGQQCPACQYHRIWQKRSACKAVFEACQICIQEAMH